MEHEEILAMFVASFRGGAKQRSKQWLADKSHSVGGSEISTLLGMNEYQTAYDLLERKLGIETFSGSVATRWGTFFEPCVERFVELDLDTKVVGSDIHVGSHRTGVPFHGNSPDGFCVVEISGERMPVLIEMKAPYSRVPNGKIPKSYEPQLWSGVWVSPVWKGLFVDAAIRLCRWDDLGANGRYLESFNVSRHKNKPQWQSPQAWGMSAFYLPVGERTEQMEEILRLCAALGGGAWVDLAELPDQMINWLMEDDWRVVHSDPQWGAQTPNEVSAGFEQEDLVGVLPWKVMQVEYVVIDPKPEYDQLVGPVLSEFFAALGQIRAAENREQGLAEFCAANARFCGQEKKKKWAPEQQNLLAMIRPQRTDK